MATRLNLKTERNLTALTSFAKTPAVWNLLGLLELHAFEALTAAVSKFEPNGKQVATSAQTAIFASGRSGFRLFIGNSLNMK